MSGRSDESTSVEKRVARRWYWWLWVSPLFTVSTVLLLYLRGANILVLSILCPDRACGYTLRYALPAIVLLLVSALWHLVLLLPALKGESAFVRWHGRQALLLSAVRTALPVGMVLLTGDEGGLLYSIPLLLFAWFFGTLWGQRQAARGVCSLMRWLGPREMTPAADRRPSSDPAKELDPEILVDLIRYGRDPEQRRRALAELERRGMVERL